jgi:hypothetical protein
VKIEWISEGQKRKRGARKRGFRCFGRLDGGIGVWADWMALNIRQQDVILRVPGNFLASSAAY